MDLQSTVSNTDVTLFANMIATDEKRSTEETISDLSRVKNDTSLPSNNNATILDMVNEEDDDELFDDPNDMGGHDDVSITSQAPRDNHGISQNAMYEPTDLHDINGADENKNPAIRREKQEILFQLLKEYPNEAKGQWNINVPLFELKYELKRRKTYETERDQIHFIKEILKLLIIGIEYGNKKLGSILELDGWANSVTSNIGQFDRCILALYRRYFKRRSMDPLVEFVWLLLGSMIMWHIQHKYLGMTSSSKRRSTDDIEPPPNQYSFNNAGPASSQMDLSNLFNLVKGM